MQIVRMSCPCHLFGAMMVRWWCLQQLFSLLRVMMVVLAGMLNLGEAGMRTWIARDAGSGQVMMKMVVGMVDLGEGGTRTTEA